MTDSLIVLLEKTHSDVPDPIYETPGSAGCDVHADEDVVIAVGQRELVRTGLRLQFPPGYECQVRPRSGLALKHGVTVFNAPGTIDSDYRGELRVLLINLSDAGYVVKRGDRIAQLVFAPVVKAAFCEVPELDRTERGEGGWGHTGTHTEAQEKC